MGIGKKRSACWPLSASHSASPLVYLEVIL